MSTGIRVIQRPKRKEGGFVAVTTAILLILLIMAAAVALDVAIWTTRGFALQRTADAAALAAVTQMPSFANAKKAAREIARRNGLDPATILVERDPISPRRIKITTTDTVPSFFGKLLRDTTEIKRVARAEFVSNINMGSRLNAIGTGSLPQYDFPVFGKQNFWLAINGYCTAKEDGDRFASAFDGNKVDGYPSCPSPISAPAVHNLDYRDPDPAANDKAQYTYVIEIPCSVPNQDPCVANAPDDTVVDIFSPYFDNNDPTMARFNIDRNTQDPYEPDRITPNVNYGSSAITTTFTLRDQDNAVIASTQFGNCASIADCDTRNGWVPAFTITRTKGGGKFKIEVSTEKAQPNSYGSNGFSLATHWASQAAGPCAPTVALPACSSIAGESSISVFANAAGNTADFFLAQLSPATDFRGKRIQVLLWDVGEGAESISILKPTATDPSGYEPFSFKYRTMNPNLDTVGSDDGVKPARNVLAPVPLDVSGKVGDPGVGPPPFNPLDRASDDRFNGRMLSLELTIPTDYGCTSSTPPCIETPLPQDGWWKIRYVASVTRPSVTDRSTWTVRLIGDPVHLVK